MRMGDGEYATLAQLQKITGENTNNGAINFVVRDYPKLREKVARLEAENRELRRDKGVLHGDLRHLATAISKALLYAGDREDER